MDTSSPEFEVMLFRSVIQHRPVGAIRHFSMAGMLSTLSQELGPKFNGISSADVWRALEKFYNLADLTQLVCTGESVCLRVFRERLANAA